MNSRVCKSMISTCFSIIIVMAVFPVDNLILGKSPGLARLLLTEDYVIMHRSPNPSNVYLYSPGIARLDSGRLVAVCRQGGKGLVGDPGMIFTSDDGGETWVQRGTFPFIQARPFVAGGTLYIIGQGNHLGQSGDIRIICSLDEGDTWSKVSTLTSGQQWHASPCNVIYANGRVYLVIERIVDEGFRGWPVSVLAPVVLAASVDDDLMERLSWTFSNEITFRDEVREESIHGIGVPFWPYEGMPPERYMAEVGWLESNIVQFYDPKHVWYDPDGKTFYLWMRAHTGATNYAAIAKVVESEEGELTVSLASAPSGKPIVYVPCPGGQMRFHITYDDVSKTYWLLSSQATDSMTRPELLPDDRYNLPDNERHRLALHFSTNCIDWCFVGLVAVGDTPKQARHYASMAIDDGDLVILSRSGDKDAKTAHDGNMITFHRVKDFRNLMY
jgi:hypothetical protein